MPGPRGLFTDVTPLRESVEFRWLWAGQSLSAIGSFMTMVAVAIQTYDLTGSSVARRRDQPGRAATDVGARAVRRLHRRRRGPTTAGTTDRQRPDGGPSLGNARAGAVTGLFGPVAGVISGGAACGLGILLLATNKPFRSYNAKADLDG